MCRGGAKSDISAEIPCLRACSLFVCHIYITFTTSMLPNKLQVCGYTRAKKEFLGECMRTSGPLRKNFGRAHASVNLASARKLAGVLTSAPSRSRERDHRRN